VLATSKLDDTARAAVLASCAEVHDAVASDAVDGVAAGLVARPSSTEEVAEVLRAAQAHQLSVVPRGRGTKLDWAMPPSTADVVLDLSRLDQVLDHAAGDLIVQAQAGAPLSTVQETVAAARQRVNVDVTVPGATVGGTLAANTSGPHRMVGGTMRDLLIGVTVVRADGVVAKAGGRVVKNVAGYDLGKLMVGSFGTLAVVTEALFRLHPAPEAQRWVTVAVADARHADELVQQVVHAQVVPAAVEVDWPAEGPGWLSVLLEGRDDGVQGRAAATTALLGAGARVEPHEDAEPPAGWGTYSWPLDATGDDRSTALKLTFVLSGLADVLATAREVGIPVALRGSAGTGVVYAALPPAPTDAVAAAVDRLRDTCHAHGGGAVVLDAPAAVKKAVDLWGPVPALSLMRRVKDQFDPDHRLSPGRFVGGI
jgi:glycolate oxidase FAD binding subunit